jgi:hypothetical protein
MIGNEPLGAMLSRREAATALKISPGTLSKLPDLPKTKIGKKVFYREEILKSWLDQHTTAAVVTA